VEEVIRQINPFFSQIPFGQSNTEKTQSCSELEKKQKTETIESRICNNYKSFTDVKNQIIKDINKLDCFISNNKENVQTSFSALSPVIPLRRISSVPDNIENGDYARAAGLVAVAGVMLPEDVRDMKDAWNQIVHKKLPNYDYKNSQAPFSFFRGTALEPIVNKMGKIGVYLHKADIPLSKTKFGKSLRTKFNIDINPFDAERTGRKVPQIGIDNETGKTIMGQVDVLAFNIKGKPLPKLIGRTLLRIPLFSVLVLGLLELPSIVKKINNAKTLNDKTREGTLQTLKSSVNLASIIAGIGLTGALFARKGPAYSVLGMGIGSVSGVYASKTVQKWIDELGSSN